MVRFIMQFIASSGATITNFTFQYGQIYYLLQTINFEINEDSLHSNMVRFIIEYPYLDKQLLIDFTFQYGQIYYYHITNAKIFIVNLYIPIWLDLLSEIKELKKIINDTLHSNMVRFIMYVIYNLLTEEIDFTFQYGQIYYI